MHFYRMQLLLQDQIFLEVQTDCLKLQWNCLHRFQPVPVLGLQPLEDQPHYHLAPDHLGQTNTRLDLQSCSFDPRFLMADMNQKVPEFQIFPELRRSKFFWKETMSEDCGQRWTGPQISKDRIASSAQLKHSCSWKYTKAINKLGKGDRKI